MARLARVRGGGVLVAFAASLSAGDFPRSLEAFSGKTPKIDGVISPGEWDDATAFSGVEGWISQFSPVRDPLDLSLRGFVKHDGSRLYFAFQVTDDVLYSVDTPRWLPPNNAHAHELSPRGWPWFGDEIELLINATNRWAGNESVAGDGTSWQMVCNATKSRAGGIGRGGLLEGEPRSSQSAWDTYGRWIRRGAQECAVKLNPAGKGYSMEWAVRFDPCLEVGPGTFYSVGMGKRAVGLNIALGDLDQPERGAGNFGNFHHEDWFAGARNIRTELKQWGILWILPEQAKSGRR